MATRGVREFLDSYITSLLQPSEPFSGGGQMARRQRPNIVQSPFDRQVTGAMEAAGTLGTGFAGAIPAGLEGLFTLARTGSPLEAGQRVEQIQEALTYQPRTQEGQEALRTVGEVLSPLAAPSEFVGQKTLEATGSPALATGAEIFGDPLNFIPGLKGTMAAMSAVPPVIAKTVRRPQSVRAPVNELGLYSKAEEVAMNMPQAKGRGDDTRRYFKKQGVKDEEIAALGLNKLFSQDRVTQEEILDHIDRNRIEIEEKISSGPSEAEFQFDYHDVDLGIEEAYGERYIDEEAKYFVVDEPERFIQNDDAFIDEYIRAVSPGLDSESKDALRILLKDYAEGTADFDELPYSIQQDVYDQAKWMVEASYNDSPVRRVTLTAFAENGEQQDVGEMPGASFSYSLVGNDDMGYSLDGTERDSVPRRIRNEIENASIFSADEAQEQLQAIANEYDDIGMMIQGETKHAEHTLPGGENYQEMRLSLPSDGQVKFEESAHFKDDVNNIFHVRTKDRELPTGEKILYVEEVQSDWAQTGRKVGFASEEKIREGEKASDELFDEIAPLLEPIDRKALYVSDSDVDDKFASSVRILSNALENYRKGGRSLNAVGDILNVMENVNLEAERTAIANLREDFLDQLTDEQKVGLYVGEVMGDFGGGEQTRERVLRNWDNDPELARQAVELEARRRVREGSLHLDAIVTRAAEKTGALPARNADGGASITSKPEWNAYLERVQDQRSRFLESKGIDPELVSKIQAALDRTDPGAAKHREAVGQRVKPGEGPFVGDTGSWNRLAVKYIFKKAAEEGYDGVSFAPGKAHVDRWPNYPKLKAQYDENIPWAIDKAIGPAPESPLNRPETMEVDGYQSRVYRLDEPTKEGESIREKMLAPTAMFGLGAAGVGLGLMAPEEAEAAGASPFDRPEDVPDYMRRLDGTVKSRRGFLGPIRNNVSGKTMTEVSMGQPGSEEGFYPLLVPTLTPEEVETIANMDLERERPPLSIVKKAKAHAMERISQGLSPFYQDGEEGGTR